MHIAPVVATGTCEVCEGIGAWGGHGVGFGGIAGAGMCWGVHGVGIGGVAGAGICGEMCEPIGALGSGAC